LTSVIIIQRWWRNLKKSRKPVPDQNLTEMIKNILNDAIKSQQISPTNELAETIKPKNEYVERKKFFDN
jgi:hypothetical protein